MAWFRFEAWPVKYQVVASPLVILLLLIITIAAGATASTQLATNSRAVAREYHNLLVTTELGKHIVEMETGIRGFALTRDPTFLTPYLTARDQVQQDLAELQGLNNGRPEQQRRLTNVAGLLAEWQSLFAGPILDPAVPFDNSLGLLQQRIGKQRTDAIRVKMDEFSQDEQAILNQFLNQEATIRTTSRQLIFTLTILALAAMAFALLTVARIVRPLQALAQASQRIAGGELGIVLPVSAGNNELTRTSAAFNSMAQALSRAHIRSEAQNHMLQEEAAAAARARLETRALIEAVRAAVVMVGTDRRLLFSNGRFAEMFGVDARQLGGHPVEELVQAIAPAFTDPPEFERFITDTVTAPQENFSMIVQQRGPRQREYDLYSAPVRGAASEWLGRVYLLRDITREREVDRMKSEFVSLVSHELRTPLTSIKGYVDLLMEGEVGELEPEQREFLEIVRNNADRLVTLINDLLDISRIESGRIELQRTPVDLAAVIREVAESLRPQVNGKNQQLTTTVPPILPEVDGDRDRLIQILTNLVSNAHKYTPRGGSIAVRAAFQDQWVRVEVQDSGIGLSEDELGQLFTRFFRAKNRATQEAGGTGLGLVITRSLVELHGGEMTVTSRPGKGSTFGFTLPISTAPRLDLPAVLPALPQGAGRILVVDDEPDIAQLIRRYLEHGGYEVTIAGTAAEAIRLARSERPRLITLDVDLPDVDGLTLLEWLKQDPLTAGVPVVLISIFGDDGQGKMLGAVEYLSKPVSETTLLERVHRILAEDRNSLILLADDDADVRGLLAGHLRRAGYQVLEAADGAETVALAHRDHPGLVLLDIRMPGMDGLAALRALRESAETRTLPVVMMTASPGMLEESRSVIEALGGDGLLRKPASPEELAAAIARGLAGVHPA